MYALRKQIYAGPGSSDIRSGKAADVPIWVPEKFFLTWADAPGRVRYMLDNKAREDGNRKALALIGWDNTIDNLNWRLREIIGMPDDDRKVSFELVEDAAESPEGQITPADSN
jgi:hypothetical protein